MLTVQSNIPAGLLESSVFSTARTARGFPYFWAVDRGRGAVRPIHARALRIELPGGAIFRKFARAAPARNITQNSLNAILGNADIAAHRAVGRDLRQWMASFLNSMASLHLTALARRTPVRTGLLARSYDVRRAV